MNEKLKLRVAFVISPSNLYSSTYSGVVRQALAWAGELRVLGHTVDFPAPSQYFDWSQCDVVHLFQYGEWGEGLIGALNRQGIPVILSPIVDRPTPYGWRGRVMAHIPFEILGLVQRQRVLYRHMRMCSVVLARSELEASSFIDLGVRPDQLRVVRLGVELWPPELNAATKKARHVFHMSHLSQPRKNVKNLIAACRKVGVQLRLAGKMSDPEFESWLRGRCAESQDIVYLGPLSEARKWEEMFNAGVFCLPSLNEGVGLVALEAHLAGAHVVITGRSGGTEYFGNEVEICDPVSVENIALCIERALEKPLRNSPRLEAQKELSIQSSANKLAEVYAGLSS